jgi:hypothetical protein
MGIDPRQRNMPDSEAEPSPAFRVQTEVCYLLV